MSALVAVYDANVLYSAVSRDLLIRLAATGAVRARWSAQIQEEWVRNLLLRRPDLDPAKLERTCRLMNEAVRDALVAGHEPLIETLNLPDPDDRHVLAAAIHAEAAVIVTHNTKDFPRRALQPYGIRAMRPDPFVGELLAKVPRLVCEAARAHRRALKNPPHDRDRYLDSLRRSGFERTAARLAECSDL